MNREKRHKRIRKIIITTILAFLCCNGNLSEFLAIWIFIYFIQWILGIIGAIVTAILFGISHTRRKIVKSMEEDIKSKF